MCSSIFSPTPSKEREKAPERWPLTPFLPSSLFTVTAAGKEKMGKKGKGKRRRKKELQHSFFTPCTESRSRGERRRRSLPEKEKRKCILSLRCHLREEGGGGRKSL